MLFVGFGSAAHRSTRRWMNFFLLMVLVSSHGIWSENIDFCAYRVQNACWLPLPLLLCVVDDTIIVVIVDSVLCCAGYIPDNYGKVSIFGRTSHWSAAAGAHIKNSTLCFFSSSSSSSSATAASLLLFLVPVRKWTGLHFCAFSSLSSPLLESLATTTSHQLYRFSSRPASQLANFCKWTVRRRGRRLWHNCQPSIINIWKWAALARISFWTFFNFIDFIFLWCCWWWWFLSPPPPLMPMVMMWLLMMTELMVPMRIVKSVCFLSIRMINHPLWRSHMHLHQRKVMKKCWHHLTLSVSVEDGFFLESGCDESSGSNRFYWLTGKRIWSAWYCDRWS